MIRVAAALSFVAEEQVAVAAQRAAANGALFIADARGYFKAESLDGEMTAYPSECEVAQAVASGVADFGVAGYRADSFS
jgi:ABC-type nitrate/sulfonate/bicarbonate transport system substrate-binding protein